MKGYANDLERYRLRYPPHLYRVIYWLGYWLRATEIHKSNFKMYIYTENIQKSALKLHKNTKLSRVK